MSYKTVSTNGVLILPFLTFEIYGKESWLKYTGDMSQAT